MAREMPWPERLPVGARARHPARYRLYLLAKSGLDLGLAIGTVSQRPGLDRDTTPLVDETFPWRLGSLRPGRIREMVFIVAPQPQKKFGMDKRLWTLVKSRH